MPAVEYLFNEYDANTEAFGGTVLKLKHKIPYVFAPVPPMQMPLLL